MQYKYNELSDVMYQAREHISNMQQDLDRITTEKDKLETEYCALQKKNTVSVYAFVDTYIVSRYETGSGDFQVSIQNFSYIVQYIIYKK